MSDNKLNVLSRAASLINRSRLSPNYNFGGEREYNEVFGYPEDPTVADYRARYERQDIARTIVDEPATTTWRAKPNVDDDGDAENVTPFEDQVETLFDEKDLLHYFERADKLAGLGRFGILFLGYADGEDDLSQPPNESALSGPEDLQYLAPFAEDCVDDIELVTDPTDERYNLPRTYDIEFGGTTENATVSATSRTETVHWKRVIHIADGLAENEIFGTPRLEAVLNRLIDLEKVVGASSELTYRGADYGLHANIDPDAAGSLNSDDLDQLEDELAAYLHDLQPMIRTQGVDLERLGGESVDPTGLVDVLLKLISGRAGIPQRILVGSERGELASSQDRATWLGRISERQQHFAEPRLLRETLDRLRAVGILDDPQGGAYTVEWGDLFELNELEQAELLERRANAIKALAPGGETERLASPGELREQLDWDPEIGSEVDGETTVTEEPDDVPEDDDDVEDQFEDGFGDGLVGVDPGVASLDGDD